MTKIVRLDRERALRLAREVASWHRPGHPNHTVYAVDMEAAFDCFVGMVRGELSEQSLRTFGGRACNDLPHHHRTIRTVARPADDPAGAASPGRQKADRGAVGD